MISPSLIWFFLKRSSKFLSLIFSIISVFLILFLQLSCGTTSQHSNYALALSVDRDSSLYSIIETNFNNDEKTRGFADLSFRIGISGICIEHLPVDTIAPFTATTQCYRHGYNFTNLKIDQSSFYELLDIDMLNSQNSFNSTLKKTKFNLIELSQHLAKTMHPKLTATTLFFQLATLAAIILSLLPNLFKVLLFKATPAFITYLLLHLISLVVLGINATFLTQVSDTSNTQFLTKLSLNIISAKSNFSFQKMIWTAFIFHILQMCGLLTAFVRMRYNMNEEIDELKHFKKDSKKDNVENNIKNYDIKKLNSKDYGNPFRDSSSTNSKTTVADSLYNSRKDSSSESQSGSDTTLKKETELYYYNI